MTGVSCCEGPWRVQEILARTGWMSRTLSCNGVGLPLLALIVFLVIVTDIKVEETAYFFLCFQYCTFKA